MLSNTQKKIEFNNHHLCHLASAYFPSGFQKALVVSYDGLGESESGAFAIGNKGKIKVLNYKNLYPNSLGLLYSCLLYTSPSPRDKRQSRMPSSA